MDNLSAENWDFCLIFFEIISENVQSKSVDSIGGMIRLSSFVGIIDIIGITTKTGVSFHQAVAASSTGCRIDHGALQLCWWPFDDFSTQKMKMMSLEQDLSFAFTFEGGVLLRWVQFERRFLGNLTRRHVCHPCPSAFSENKSQVLRQPWRGRGRPTADPRAMRSPWGAQLGVAHRDPGHSLGQTLWRPMAQAEEGEFPRVPRRWIWLISDLDFRNHAAKTECSKK